MCWSICSSTSFMRISTRGSDMATLETSPASAFEVAAAAADEARQRAGRRRWLKALRANKAAMVSGGVLIFIVTVAILAPVIAPHDPKFIDPGIRLQSPALSEYWWGTDDFGRDVLSRVMYGAR